MTRSPATVMRSHGPQPDVAQRVSDLDAVNSLPREDDDEFATAERYLRVLHPSRRNGAMWFKNNTEVSTCVRKIIENCFRGPWYSWKRVPSHYKRAWFSTFKTKFEWNPSIDNLVEANFEILAASRLRGMISLAKSKKKKPDWILGTCWEVMLKYWSTSEAKDRSEKARASRLFTRDGLGEHKHRSGSRSYAKVQDALKANNEDYSFIAVLKKTHKKPDGTFVDEKARQVAEKYEEYAKEYLSQKESSVEGGLTVESLTLAEKNEIYTKIVGASKQGRVFGLGSLQSGGLKVFKNASVSPQADEETETMTHRLEELETELKKSRDENLLFKKRIEAMEDFCFGGTNSA